LRLSSKKAYRIVRFLLENPETNQSLISEGTGVAYGWVNEIVNFLYQLDIVSKGWRKCTLKDPVRLLEMIAFERPLSRLEIESFRLETTSALEGENLLRDVCEDNGVKYGLTMFSGLKRYYQYHIAYPSIHAYISTNEVEGKIPHGEGPITLILLSPDHLDILKHTRRVEGFSICSPTQTAIDLFCSGVGRDAAVKFIEMWHK